MPDGEKVEGSVTAHPFDGGASMVLRYGDDGRREECKANMAPFNSTLTATCRAHD